MKSVMSSKLHILISLYELLIFIDLTLFRNFSCKILSTTKSSELLRKKKTKRTSNNIC